MPQKKSENSEQTLKELLINTDHEKLVDILLSFHSSNKDVQKQLDIIFASEHESPDEMVRMIRKEISSLKKAVEFSDYYESDFLTGNLDDMYSKIKNDLNAKSPNIAFDVMLDFLDLHENIINSIDDSNCDISDLFMTACQDLGAIGQNINHLSIQKIVEIVFDRFTNNQFSVYDNIIIDCKDMLKNQGLDLLQKKFKKTANKLGLKSVADSKNDVDLYIEACSLEDKIRPHDHLEIAERLIKHQRAKEAIQWLDTMETDDLWPNYFSKQNNRKELKIQALELDGRHEDAQKERLSWFANSLSSSLYKNILKVSNQNFQKAFQLDTIKKAFQFPQPYIALNFLLEIQEFEKLAQFVRARFEELNGEQYYTLRPAAEALQLVDPLAATFLYRKMLEPVVEKAKNKYYNYAAKDLVTCGVLDSHITDWKTAQKHDTYFKELEVKHKRKVSFWAEYESALQSQAAKEAKKAALAEKNE